MKLYLHDHPASVTADELARDLLTLPSWRRQKALSFRFLIDRVLCTKAYLLLRQGLRECYGIDGNPEFAYIGHDNPVLKDYPDIHFNISHCRRGLLVVLDDHPIGCDIEEIETSLDMNLCHHCYNNREIAEIVASAAPLVSFTTFWTRKEAVLKLTGEGIDDNLPALFDGDLMERVRFQTVVDHDNAFVYTVCQYRLS